AGPSAALVEATARAALAFAARQGIAAGASAAASTLAMKGLHAMRMTWISKALAVTVALGAAGAGAGLLAPQAPAPGPAQARAEALPPPGRRPEPEPPAREEGRQPEARLKNLLMEWARRTETRREARYTFR